MIEDIAPIKNEMIIFSHVYCWSWKSMYFLMIVFITRLGFHFFPRKWLKLKVMFRKQIPAHLLRSLNSRFCLRIKLCNTGFLRYSNIEYRNIALKDACWLWSWFYDGISSSFKCLFFLLSRSRILRICAHFYFLNKLLLLLHSPPFVSRIRWSILLHSWMRLSYDQTL